MTASAWTSDPEYMRTRRRARTTTPGNRAARPRSVWDARRALIVAAVAGGAAAGVHCSGERSTVFHAGNGVVSGERVRFGFPTLAVGTLCERHEDDEILGTVRDGMREGGVRFAAHRRLELRVDATEGAQVTRWSARIAEFERYGRHGVGPKPWLIGEWATLEISNGRPVRAATQRGDLVELDQLELLWPTNDHRAPALMELETGRVVEYRSIARVGDPVDGLLEGWVTDVGSARLDSVEHTRSGDIAVIRVRVAATGNGALSLFGLLVEAATADLDLTYHAWVADGFLERVEATGPIRFVTLDLETRRPTAKVVGRLRLAHTFRCGIKLAAPVPDDPAWREPGK